MTKLENIKQRITLAKSRIDTALTAVNAQVQENANHAQQITAVKQELDDAIMDLESYIKGKQ